LSTLLKAVKVADGTLSDHVFNYGVQNNGNVQAKRRKRGQPESLSEIDSREALYRIEKAHKMAM